MSWLTFLTYSTKQPPAEADRLEAGGFNLVMDIKFEPNGAPTPLGSYDNAKGSRAPGTYEQGC